MPIREYSIEKLHLCPTKVGLVGWGEREGRVSNWLSLFRPIDFRLIGGGESFSLSSPFVPCFIVFNCHSEHQDVVGFPVSHNKITKLLEAWKFAHATRGTQWITTPHPTLSIYLSSLKCAIFLCRNRAHLLPPKANTE